MRISHFGTFDVANYGDLLFPLVARKRLQALRGVSLEHISPVGAGPIWFDSVDTIGFQRFVERHQGPDGILIGGGNIIQLTATTVPPYERDLVPLLAYADLWMGATACAAVASTPVCWNAPGVPKRFPASLHSLVRRCLERADYISVRDDPSRERLLETWPDAHIEVVPDTAWEVDQLWSLRELPRAQEVALRRVSQPPPQRSLAIHVNSRYLGDRGPAAVARHLDDLCRRLDARGVLLAMGPCHGDDGLARQVGAAMKTDPIVIDRPGGLQELAACIALAVAYVGSSMHGFITAAAFGVPAMCVATAGASKFRGLFAPLGLSNAWSETWDSAPALLLATDLESRRDELQRVRQAIQPRIDRHWATIASFLGGGGGRSSPREATPVTAPQPSIETAQSYRTRVLETIALEELRAHRTEAARRRTLETRIRTLRAGATERDHEVASLRTDLGAQAAEIKALTVDVAGRRREIASLHAGLAERQREVASLRKQLLGLTRQLSSTRATLDLAINSASWKLTTPLRAISAVRRTWPPRLARGVRAAAYMIPRLLTRHPGESVHVIHAFLALRRSRAFDAGYYLRTNPDVAAAGVDPLMHYLFRGARERRDPSPDFSTASYLERHPEVAALRLNPLMHHLRRAEQRSTAAIPAPVGPPPVPRRWEGGRRAPQPGPHHASLFSRRLRDVAHAGGEPGLLGELESNEARITALCGAFEARTAPLVTIIMATHDQADAFTHAAESLLEQDYAHWELLVCDHGTSGDTEAAVAGFGEPRILYLRLPGRSAAQARNAGLSVARGDLIAYLDGDTIWHPRYVSCMVAALGQHPGQQAAYCNVLAVSTSGGGSVALARPEPRPFDHRRVLDGSLVPLTGFVHRKELASAFGGFDETPDRQHELDLILRYTWLRDPLHVDGLLLVHHHRGRPGDGSGAAASTTEYYRSGLPRRAPRAFDRVTVVSWDVCRNHFSKPFAVAEALSADYEVQLIGFRFFEEGGFVPLRNERPPFECVFLDGSDFPAFGDALARAVARVTGDFVYVVKPRLPSLGLGLLANYHFGKPMILEANDLETAVARARKGDQHMRIALSEADPRSPALLNPYSDQWSRIMDAVAAEVPVIASHNRALDKHFASASLYMRNIKDETVYDPALYDRRAIRRELGFADSDRVILFGGQVRAHKGVFELVTLKQKLADPRYKLLLVGSRMTPDQARLEQKHGTDIIVLPPQDRTAMARINLAADLVIIWLNPEVLASHYQMPYKLSDAFAMKVPVIANDISDLGELGRQGYLRLVPFGDWEAMVRAVRDILDEGPRTAAMVEASRALFLRQFSYSAARANITLATEHLRRHAGRTLPVSARFAAWFAEFNAFARSHTSLRRP